MTRPAFPTNNGFAPKIGPKILPVYSQELDFSSVTTIALDFVKELEGEVIGEIQSVYIDNLNNPNALTLTVAETQFRITALGNTQGMYPVGGIANKLAVQSAATTSAAVALHFFNVPMAPFVWGPGALAIPTTILVATGLGDAADVTMTGAAVLILPANANRVDAILTAPAGNAGSIRIGTQATVGAARGAEMRPGSALSIQTEAAIYAFGTAPDKLSITFTTQ